MTDEEKENEELKEQIETLKFILDMDNNELVKENEKLNKKIRRYEEMLVSIFAAGNMIMQEKSKYEELRRL